MPSGEKGDGDPLGKEQITKRTFLGAVRALKKKKRQAREISDANPKCTLMGWREEWLGVKNASR